METETQRPKNERTPGDPVGEGRRGSWERAPRPPFRPTPFPAWPQEAPEEGPTYYPYDGMHPAQSEGSARPSRPEGFNGSNGPDALDGLGNFVGSARPEGFRPATWREPWAANPPEQQDPFQAENPRSAQSPFVEGFPSQNPSEPWVANPRKQQDPFQAENPRNSQDQFQDANPRSHENLRSAQSPFVEGFTSQNPSEPQAANLRNSQDPFQATNPRNSENLRSPQPREKRAPGFFFFLIGGLLLLTAAVFTAINLVEAEQARRATAALIDALPSDLSEELSARPSLEAKDSSKRPEPDWPMPQRIVNGEEIIGVIEIPRTGLMLPVLSSWDYDKLKRYPCYYHGSIYRKDAVFCSHDYPFQFGGLNVLEDGDEARFLDADGNLFTYAFREQEYLQPTDVEAMTFKDDWDLTLFTCAYNGLARYAYRFEETGFRAKP